MDEARCKELDRVVTSEELYIIENVKSKNYVCNGCSIALLPCSFDKEKNLRKPYFKTRKGIHHDIGCGAEGLAKIRKRGATSRLSTTEGFPLAYPNRFKTKINDVANSPVSVELEGSTPSRSNKVRNEGRDTSIRKSNYETTSFKSIVNQYFDFPFDRDRELNFEEVVGDSYNQIFKKILSTRGKQQFLIQGEAQKVYYAPLSWKRCKEDNDNIKIELSPGRWVEQDGKQKNERPFYLEINFAKWPKQTKTKFLNEYDKITTLVRGTDKKAAIAFVGKQDTNDDYFRFEVTDRRLIAIKVFNDA